MEVTIKNLGRVKFSIQARSHTVICDQPVENGGDDSGMTPPELMLASLGSCAAFYAVQYLKARNLAESGVEVSVTADKLLQPVRLGNFRVHVTCATPLTEGQTEGLMRSVHHCLIRNTLISLPDIIVELNVAETSKL
ncbi:MAG TPA: OsmC family protein [Acidobacteriaceae bacterium]